MWLGNIYYIICVLYMDSYDYSIENDWNISIHTRRHKGEKSHECIDNDLGIVSAWAIGEGY